MASIELVMKDGTVKKFPHVPRAGGSYTKEVKYEGSFVIIVDEYCNTTAFPMADIAQVNTWPDRY